MVAITSFFFASRNLHLPCILAQTNCLYHTKWWAFYYLISKLENYLGLNCRMFPFLLGQVRQVQATCREAQHWIKVFHQRDRAYGHPCRTGLPSSFFRVESSTDSIFGIVAPRITLYYQTQRGMELLFHIVSLPCSSAYYSTNLYTLQLNKHFFYKLPFRVKESCTYNTLIDLQP